MTMSGAFARIRNSGVVRTCFLTGILAFSFALPAYAVQAEYGHGTIAGYANFDSSYVTWVGSNKVTGANRKCAGQTYQDHTFYGSYACATSGNAIKTYPSSGSRRARAHNGESGYQYIQGYIVY